MGRTRRGRNRAKDFAILGAIQGVTQGINQAIADKRAASLQEIALQYRAQERAADQAFKTTQEETRFQNNMKVAEKTHKLNREPKDFDWNDNSLMKTFSNVAEAKAANDPTALKPRETTTTAGQSAALKDTIWYSNATPEQRAIYDRVNKITELGGGLSVEDQEKAVLSLYKEFEKKTGFDKKSAIKSLGIDPDLTGQPLRDAVLSAYQGTVTAVAGSGSKPEPTGGAISLLNGDQAATPATATATAPAPAATPADNTQHDAAMAQAREAIAQNRDPEVVKKMLRDMGVPEELIGTL